jgi:hypothetical protein
VLLNVHPVGFEPTSTNTFKLELNPLDLMTMQTRPHISSWHVRQILTQKCDGLLRPQSLTTHDRGMRRRVRPRVLRVSTAIYHHPPPRFMA